MRAVALVWNAIFLGCGVSLLAQTQNAPSAPQTSMAVASKHHRSPGGDIGSGAGDMGKGVGKGIGSAAKGAGKGTVDLVTLHPINAAGDIGKGGVIAGKDVGVGAAKGTGKIMRGTGRAIKKIF